MTGELLHRELTEKIIGVFYQVHSELGPGFLESVYANGVAIALIEAGLSVAREVPVAVYFRGRRIGKFRADTIVESKVLLELKAGDRLDQSCEAQVINYLRATTRSCADSPLWTQTSFQAIGPDQRSKTYSVRFRGLREFRGFTPRLL